MCLLFTQMNAAFFVALILLGSLMISMDVFPNQWEKLNEKPMGGQIIRMIKGLSLSLIIIAFWLRVYQNMYETKDAGADEDKVFAKVFEVVLNLIVVSILPAVGAWTAYQNCPQLLRPTNEWGTTTTEESLTNRRSRRLSRQQSYGVTSSSCSNYNENNS